MDALDARHETKRDALAWIVLATGVLSIGNALWMLVGPMHWYTDLPAAVPDTGPFNPHFVRDIGCAFLATGIALVWADRRPRARVPLVSVAAIFLAAHAALHAYDTLRGALGHDHWLLDLPGVYFPGVAIPWIAWRWAREDDGLDRPRRRGDT
ncbi:MAG: hypothetical protein NXI30_11335 [bacterium]|nr:hypothetical protein [bacterium]